MESSVSQHNADTLQREWTYTLEDTIRKELEYTVSDCRMHKFFSIVHKFGIVPRLAVEWRMEYLIEQLNDWFVYIEYEGKWKAPLPYGSIYSIAREMFLLHKHLDMIRKPVVNRPDIVSDAMIESARHYPIENLFERLTAGKTEAWCHDDKRPSLSIWRKKNVVRCFVCDKTFDTIAVLMDRDGCSFKEAVRKLSVEV